MKVLQSVIIGVIAAADVQRREVYDYYGDFSFDNASVGKSQPNGNGAAAVTLNGFSCHTCNASSYALCASTGTTHNCQDEQFHCSVEEEKHMGNVVRVTMGCKQDTACRRDWLQNAAGGTLNGVDIAGLNASTRYPRVGSFGNTNNQNNQCSTSNSEVTSICRQCCKTAACSDSFKTNNGGSGIDWDSTTDHDFGHLIEN